MIQDEIEKAIENHLNINCYKNNLNLIAQKLSIFLQEYRKIYDFKVTCDESNNPPLIRDIYVKIDIFIQEYRWTNIIHIEKNYYGSIKEIRKKKLEKLYGSQENR